MARNHGLRYVHLEDSGDSKIGVITNGAGHCLATCDMIKNFGGHPANFLDLGGSAYHEKVLNSLIMMDKDEDVNSILVNVFCGQLSAKKISIVILDAVKKGFVKKPIVCRIKGSFSVEAVKMIKELNSN